MIEGLHRQTRTILLIDADEDLRNTLGRSLRGEGFMVAMAADGESGLEQAISCNAALILTELCLPGLSGIEICKSLRTSGVQTPIIVLSSAGEETDKVRLLDIGADDYVVKPAGTRELLARIRAVLRRAERIISFAKIQVDTERRVITRSGQEVKLTPAEYRLLLYFLQNRDRPLSRFRILNSVWGIESPSNTRTVDAYVLRLRKKLEADPACPRHFMPYKGLGYRFVP
jgi:DNA-binding response OmpR family regulator